MKTDTNSTSADGIQISIDLPLQDDRLLSGNATADILLFLSRNHDESFSMTDLADAIGYTRPTITKTVDTLSKNDLVIEEHDGPRRLVQINHVGHRYDYTASGTVLADGHCMANSLVPSCCATREATPRLLM